MDRHDPSTTSADASGAQRDHFTAQGDTARVPEANRDSMYSQRNPFATPALSIHSRLAPSIKPGASGEGPRRRFRSSRLVGVHEKPWLVEKRWVLTYDTIVFYTGVLIALALGGYVCYNAVVKVPGRGVEYCLIMDDEFTTFDTTNTWNHEIQLNGFGTGSFDWTTDDEANSYVDEAGLHIVPTLTTATTDITYAQLLNGYTVNLTADGSCTTADQRVSDLVTDILLDDPCVAHSNSTKHQIINPVRSARLTTQGKKSIKYGRVEVIAKMPAGDWLWPAIWMMPEDSIYGGWPRSGEIDIAESKGNDAETYPIGNNIVSSALHWGTAWQNDAYMKSHGEWGSKRTKYSDGFHSYGLEWSEKYLFTWLDGRLRQVLFFNFDNNKNLWTYGDFAGIAVNGSVPSDPWSWTGRPNTPFDQNFYLILNVAVGSTNGYFPDNIGQKPWTDSSETAMSDFWTSNQTWYPTWGAGDAKGMTVKSVKMWQEGSC